MDGLRGGCSVLYSVSPVRNHALRIENEESSEVLLWMLAVYVE
jgi:hypothetical protein